MPGSIFLSLLNNSKPREHCLLVLDKEKDEAKVTRIKLLVPSTDFTAFHGYYLSSSESQAQTGITKRYSWFKIHFLWYIPIPWLVVSTNEVMIRNFSLTLENISKSATKEITVQQKSLDSISKVALDNRIALDYLLAEQGVCAMANTTCCTWTDTS